MTSMLCGRGRFRASRWAVFAAAWLLVFDVQPVWARNVEPGRLFVGAGLGIGARLPTPMTASPAAGLLTLNGEYTLHKAISVVADLTLGMANTYMIVGAAGARGRLTDLKLALSPHAQVELAAGGLFDVLGANVPFVGSRLGVGVDYFLTAQSTASLGLLALVGGTVSERSAFYGMIQVLLSFSVGHNAARRPVPRPLPVLGA